MKEYVNEKLSTKLIEMMERGIVIHHGSIPLKGRLLLLSEVLGTCAIVPFTPFLLHFNSLSQPFAETCES